MPSYAKRPKGRGQIKPDAAHGVYRGRVMVAGHQYNVTGRTHKDAAAKLDAILDGAEAGAGDAANPPTLGAWFAVWVDDVAVTKTENTRANRKWAIGALAPLHGRRMDEILTHHVEAVLQAHAAAGKRRASIVRMRTVGKMAFDSYNGRHGKTFNPFTTAINIGDPAAPQTKHALTPKQTRDLLAVADATPRYGIVATLGVFLGLRPGEVAGLTWDALDLAAATLDVRQSRRSNADYSLTMAPPKANSYRVLVMPPPLVDALRRHKAAQAAEGLWSHTGLVVCTAKGAPLDPWKLRRRVKRMAEAAGIPFRVTPNELRHTAITLLVNSGAPLLTVADMAGHRDTRMIHGHYRHKDTGAVDTASAMIAAVGQ